MYMANRVTEETFQGEWYTSKNAEYNLRFNDYNAFDYSIQTEYTSRNRKGSWSLEKGVLTFKFYSGEVRIVKHTESGGVIHLDGEELKKQYSKY
jgi:hypothetical protein